MSQASNPTTERRLGSVLLQQHLWLLTMLLLNAIIGGLWIHAWQQASTESLRINSMMRDAQQLYRDVYRQAREAVVASQTTDGLSVTQYWEHVYDMDARFERLEQQLQQTGEANALAGMRHAYGMMQTQINVLLTERTHEDPYKLIVGAVERWITGVFADAYSPPLACSGQSTRGRGAAPAALEPLGPVGLPVAADRRHSAGLVRAPATKTLVFLSNAIHQQGGRRDLPGSPGSSC